MLVLEPIWRTPQTPKTERDHEEDGNDGQRHLGFVPGERLGGDERGRGLEERVGSGARAKALAVGREAGCVGRGDALMEAATLCGLLGGAVTHVTTEGADARSDAAHRTSDSRSGSSHGGTGGRCRC